VDSLGLESLATEFKDGKLQGTAVSFVVDEQGQKGSNAERKSIYPLDLWRKIQEDIEQEKADREKWAQERDAYINNVGQLIADAQLPENVRDSLHIEMVESKSHGAPTILYNPNVTKTTCLFIGQNAALLLREESYYPYDLDYFHGYKPASMLIKTANLDTVDDLLKQEVEIAPRRERFRDRIVALYEGSVRRGRNLPYDEILKGDWRIFLVSYEDEDDTNTTRYFPAQVGVDSCVALRYKENIYQLEENDIKRLEDEIKHRFPSL
jgi:hypothetical protein